MENLKRLHSLGFSSSDYEIKYVDQDADYTKDEKWQKLKAASSKAYAKLKEREYHLRFNIKK